VDDLGADSLDQVELIMAIEEAFEIEIPDEDAEKMEKVKDAIDYLKTHLRAEVMTEEVPPGRPGRTGKRAMNEKVVITGVGAVTPLGLSAAEFWRGLIEGRPGVGPVTRFDVTPTTRGIAGELKGFDPGQLHGPQRGEAGRSVLPVRDRRGQGGDGAEPARSDRRRRRANRCIIGSGIGGATTWEGQHTVLMEKGPSRVSPFFVPMMIADMAAGQVSMTYGLRGANFATVSACACGRPRDREAGPTDPYRGAGRAALAGGSEAPITPLSLAGFCSLKALSARNDGAGTREPPVRERPRRFRHGRRAAILVLESESHAKGRGARILGELADTGRRPTPITSPLPPGWGGSAAGDATGLEVGPAARPPRRSITSMRTAPRRRSTTSSRRWRFTRSSERGPAKSA